MIRQPQMAFRPGDSATAMTDDQTDETVAWYDRQATGFAAQTADLDMASIYSRFIRYVPAGGRILDVGCGVGRDALAFVERGFSVTAFDASSEMVRLAEARLGSHATVRHLRFEDVTWHEEFDGIWACASLLHVPQASFLSVALRLADALRPRGAWYMSFKLGEGERIADGRLFVDHTEATLRAALKEIPVELVEAWTTQDVRPSRTSERWINAVMLRRAKLR
jgi:SAM-dependent methyltransferase